MQNKFFRCLSLFLLIGSLQLKAATFTEIDSLGRSVLQSFNNKEFKKLQNMVDPNYQNYYSDITFERDWNELIGTYGKYMNSKPVNFEKAPHYSFIAYKINFEYLPYILNLSFNDKKELIYVSFMQAHKIYFAPDYADVSKFVEEKFSFQNEGYELNGLLTMPNSSGKAPLVVILGEAGPTDKDGSYDENRPYKDIAWGIASKGYAVYRYDKRSINNGIMMMSLKAGYNSFTCREDYLDDLYKALDTLESLAGIDKERVYVLGHGQGGMLLPLVAKERKDVKGIIMLGTNAKRIQEMMIDQYAYLSTVTPNKKEEYDEQALKALKSMNKKLNPLTEHKYMPYEVQATYWIWFNKYKHLDIAKKLKKPILILHGNRDYQVNMENLKLWEKTLGENENVSIKSYPKLNHLFYTGDAESTYSEYYLKSNIPGYVLKDINDWLLTH
ncbi:MAG: dienelactone hydrolase family protein [Bacteroidia bacterium]|nr:dienelactone hydrolase family protein [Bacteroidia bacterium]